jgi:hypothetical protein
MQLHTKEHHDIMYYFEKNFKEYNLAKESKELWSRNIFYQSGEVNNLFLAYRLGYSLGKSLSD